MLVASHGGKGIKAPEGRHVGSKPACEVEAIEPRRGDMLVVRQECRGIKAPEGRHPVEQVPPLRGSKSLRSWFSTNLPPLRGSPPGFLAYYRHVAPPGLNKSAAF
jgi:hypothetical protein